MTADIGGAEGRGGLRTAKALAATAALLSALAFPQPAAALNKAANPGFETNPEPGTTWTAGGTAAATQNAFARITSDFRSGAASFQGRWTGTANTNTPNVNRYISQPFTPSANAQIALRAFYKRTGAGAVDSFTLRIALREGSATGTVRTSFEYVNPPNSAPPTDASWQDTLLTTPFVAAGGTTYYLTIEWVAQLDNTESAGALVDDVFLSVSPAGLAASSVADTSNASLTWTASTGTPGLAGSNPYRIYRGTSPGATASIGYSGTASYTDATSDGNTTYYFAVSDIDANGVESPKSPEATVLTRPGAPGTPTFSSIGQTSVTVSWGAPATGATSYRLERGASSTGPWTTSFSNATSPHVDGTVSGNSTYWYRAVPANASGDGVPSEAASVTTPAGSGSTTTVGDAASPADGTIPPGAAARAVDAFTLRTSTGTDSILSATVTLSSGAWAGLSAVSINDAAGCNGTALGSVAPTSSTVVVPLTGVTATTTLQTLWVCVTPKTHAAMPLPPGASYAVAGTVTSVLSTNTKTYQDTASATVTVDNRSPANVSWGAITTASQQVTLNWVNPPDTDFVVVLSTTGGPVASTPVEGATYVAGNTIQGARVRYVGPLQTFTDTLLTNGIPYYYKAFVRDPNGNYSVGIPAGPAYPGTNPLPVGDTGTDSTKPMISIVNPGAGTVVSGVFRVRVRVWSPGAAIGTVAVTSNLGADGWPALSKATEYGGTATSGVWAGEITLDPGTYTLVARATNDGGATYVNSAPVGIVVKPAGTGDGNLLVRDNASQLCTDCHAMTSHSSEALGTTYGTWAAVCRDCHTPHGTTNIFLVPQQITPPPVGSAVPVPKDVVFLRKSELSNAGNTGPCQVCHTRTKFYRADGTSPGGTHGTGDCTSCHKHTEGLRAKCNTCHGDKTETRTLITGADDLAMAAPPDVPPEAIVSVANGGAHLGHVNKASWRTSPFACSECHPSSNTHQGTTDMAWSTLATGGGTVTVQPPAGALSALWPASPSCTNWCHGDGLAGGGAGVATPLWNGPAAHGACGACHGTPPPVDAAAENDHPQNPACSACHGSGYMQASLDVVAKVTHLDGALAKPANGCTACHGDLAGLSGLGQPNTNYASAPGYTPGVGVDTEGNTTVSYVGVGAHSAHVTNGLMGAKSCTVCHGTLPPNLDTTHANGTVAAAWSSPASAYGVSPQPPGPTFTAAWELSPSCSNYCHSNAVPLRGSYTPAPQTWTSGTAMGCTSCHGAGGAASTLSPAHRLHTDAAKYNYGCQRCHATTTGDGTTITGPATHVDGLRTVAFNALPFDPGGAYSTTVPFGCSANYCHSTGVARTAPYMDPVAVLSWNTVGGDFTCDKCHGGNAAAANKLSTRSHGAHVNNAAFLGTNFGCATCHDTAATDTSIAAGKWGQHVNRAVEVPGTSYADGTANGVADGSCATNYCHSNGTEIVDYVSAQWGVSALDCRGCHGSEGGSIAGEPRYGNVATADDTRNSHAEHVASAASCVDCHESSIDATGTLVSAGTHLDGTVQLTAGAGKKIGAYAQSGERCSNITCHGTTPNSAQWGVRPGCADCHRGTNDAPNYNLTDDVVTMISSTEWVGSGHGQTTSAFTAAGKFVASATDRCVYCHDPAVAHELSTNPFRLRGAAASNGITAAYSSASAAAVIAVCLNCHAESGTVAYGVDPDTTTGGQPKVGPATKRIDTYHAGGKHTTNDGGQRCWDCHDVHGDGNLLMIGKNLVRDSTDIHGFARTPLLVDVSFASTSVVSSYAKTASPFTGVCQVCHTATDYWRGDGTLATHNETLICTTCHEHQNTVKTNAFEGAGACSACHLAPAGAGNQDVNNYVNNNGTRAMIDREDWLAYGHGATAAFAESGNAAPAFPVTTAVEGCYYCHAPDTAQGTNPQTSAHGDAANPFRLANNNWNAKGKNGTCLVCHDSAGTPPGYDPDGTGGTFTLSKAASAAARVNAYHYGGEHTATGGGDGGELCWDCHDPHGDYNYGATQQLAYMFQEQPVRTHVAMDPNGWGVPDVATELAPAPDFRNNRDGTAGFAWGDYVSNTLVGGTYRGVCQVCHTAAGVSPAASISYFRQDLYSTHNSGTICTSCHKHVQPTGSENLAFKGEGSCKGCHGAAQGSGATARVRIVGNTVGNEGDDFIRPSRHVSNGSASEIVTNVDCILCHAEGDAVTSTDAAPTTSSAWHGGDGGSKNVELRNVDTGGVRARWTGTRTVPLANGAANTAQRDAMDSFCMGCHDADGASAIAVAAGNSVLERTLTPLAVATGGMTRAGSTVTVTVANTFVANDRVILEPGEANFARGVKQVVTANATSFTYTEAGTAGSSTAPATVTEVAYAAVGGVVRAGSTVTVTTATAHGFATGNAVAIGPGEPNFLPGIRTITVSSATVFTYTEAGTAGSSTAAQTFWRAAARATTPFNTADTRANGTAASPRDSAAINALRTRVADVKSRFNLFNLTGKNWASHHNLNQFTKRYGGVNANWASTAWTSGAVTKEGQTLTTTREQAGLHCADCHLNEKNAHGSRSTFYMLANSTGNDVAFSNVTASNATHNCAKCHNPTTYSLDATDTSSRTGYHGPAGRCNNVDQADISKLTAVGGTTQMYCLGCHGGSQLGEIHGTNENYKVGNPTGAGSTTKKYRFMGTGGSMRFYSPSGTDTVTDASWESTATPGCYTISSSTDTYGGCTQHSKYGSAGGATKARNLAY